MLVRSCEVRSGPICGCGEQSAGGGGCTIHEGRKQRKRVCGFSHVRALPTRRISRAYGKEGSSFAQKAKTKYVFDLYQPQTAFSLEARGIGASFSASSNLERIFDMSEACYPCDWKCWNGGL